MNILLINYEYPPLGGGGGNATAYLAKELTGLASEVRVLTSAFRGLPRVVEKDGLTIRRVPVVRRYADRCTPWEMLTFMMSASVAALRMASRWRPDFTIAFFGIPSGPVAWLVKAVYGVPYIVSLRGGDVPGFQAYDLGTYHRLSGFLIRFIWHQARLVVANSWGLRSLAWRWKPDVPVEVIPNGVDVELFRPRVSATGDGPLQLLFVGRLTRQKGVDVLIKSLHLIKEEVSIEAQMVGDGDKRSELEMLVKQLGLKDRVTFLGWRTREEIPTYYQRADIFVLPSRDEGMPNVVLEAMACGLPVIATRIAGNEELVREGETGLLVPCENSLALAQALAKLSGDEALRKRMGEAGRLLVQERFRWDQVAWTYLAMIESVVGKHLKTSA